MHRKLIPSLIVAAVGLLPGPCPAADALDSLQGQWTVKKSRDGESFSQVLEITKDQLTFKMLSNGGDLRFFARGSVQTEKLGPFNVLKISNIEAGASADEAKSVDDVRSSVYLIDEGTLTLASNLDKPRENQPPTLDIYTRTAAPKASASASGSVSGQLVGKWKMEATLGDTPRNYELRFAQAKDGLETVIVSERSGEHKCKTTTLKGDEVVMELDRTIEGNDITFVYKGKLADRRLSGTLAVKGREDEFTGKWTATK